MKALITGASSGLGRDMAVILSDMGYDIIAVARRREKLEELKDILNQFKIGGMTVLSVMGCGNQKGDANSSLKGLKVHNINLIPKILCIVAVKTEDVEKILEAIYEKIPSGRVGDGKVFVEPIEDVMRIRTGERGEKAL